MRSQSEDVEVTQRLAPTTETVGRIRVTRAKGLISGGEVVTAKDGDQDRDKG